MEKVEQVGRSCLLVMDAIQSPGKESSLSENIGSVIDGAITAALSCPASRGLEDTV